jgi:membrane associated rhomboid family serine protease
MIPISDNNPMRRVPIVTWALIAVNIAVFLFELTLRARQLDQVFMTWGATPTYVLFGLAHPFQTPPVVWLTLITSQFLHAGWAHILGNMIFLWVFGDNIEDVLGHSLFLVFYLVCGVAAGIVQSIISGPSSAPSIGASGAIAGVLGAYLVLFPWARVTIVIPIIFLPWTLQVPALFVLGWWFVQQSFYGIAAISSAAAGGIAFWAHIGGFVLGMILILPFIGRTRRRRVVRYYAADTAEGWPGAR